MDINASPVDSTAAVSDQSYQQGSAACAGDKCRHEAATLHHGAALGSPECKDLPSCKITSAEEVAPLSGKIAGDMSVSKLIKHHIFAKDTEDKHDTAGGARNETKDKVTGLTIVASTTGKLSGQADFFVSAAGVVTAEHNPDHNKKTALTIEFETNPASKKNASDLTPAETAELQAQKVAFNTLTDYLHDRYGDATKWSVDDGSGTVAEYLKSPDADPQTLATGTVDVSPPPAPAGYGGAASVGEEFLNQRRFAAPQYPEHPPLPWQASNPYTRASYAQPSPFMVGQRGVSAFNPGFYYDGAALGPTESINPFELTAFSLLGWLNGMGVDLGNPPDPAKLEKAIKKLEKEDPKLAKELKSKEFKDLIEKWHTTGKPPTDAELAKALPQKLNDQISHDLMSRYTAKFKGTDGKIDWGKVAVSVHDGKVATAADMKEHADIAAEAVAFKTGFKTGEIIPQNMRIPVIEAGLKLAGVPVTSQNIASTYHIITRESSWNPCVVNTWDSNAAKGTPSIGLMQPIGPTFRAYHVPGHNDITNPEDNIAACVLYATDKYGHGNVTKGLLIAAARPNY